MARLIDAEALSERVKYALAQGRQKMWFGECTKIVLEMINDQPTEYAVQHGCWRYYQEKRSMGLINMRRCSVCGRTAIRGGYGDPAYCDQCGTKMDQEAVDDVKTD